MSILSKIALFLIITAFVFSEDCSFNSGTCNYDINLQFFNENILTYYFSSFEENSKATAKVFSYQIIPEGENCTTTFKIQYELRFFSPEISSNEFENFYNGITEIEIVEGINYFSNLDFIFGSYENLIPENYNEALVTYISQSGKLPNGQYYFYIRIFQEDMEICNFSHIKEINRPMKVDLLYPGGLFSDLSTSIIYNTNPIFLWHSDYCSQCNYAIRISEYKPAIHNSIQESFSDDLLLPVKLSQEYYELPSNSFSFHPDIYGSLDLEIGKYYVWQIKRSYETTFESHSDYSPFYVFEIRIPTKKQIDFSDPYLSLIQVLIGQENFNLLFSTGGELERFITNGNSVWINDEEIHIDILYSLVNDLKQGKIKIEDYQLK